MRTDGLGVQRPAGSQAQHTRTDLETLYAQSVQHFQGGRWKQAIAGLEEVLLLRPDHAQAGALLEQARLKASLDRHGPRPTRSAFWGLIRSLVPFLVIGAAVLVLATSVRWVYGRWRQSRATPQVEATPSVDQLAQAQEYLAERDYAAAVEAFGALLAQDPGNEEAQQGLAQAQEEMASAETYASAQQAIAAQDWNEARRLLADLGARNPGYRDVQQLQVYVGEQLQLGTWFDKAEAAYRAGDWLEAIAAYESLRDLNTAYRKQTVTEHLFQSYLRQGVHWTDSTKGDPVFVRDAIGLYQQALTLKPQDAQASLQLALAEKYLEGVDLLAEADLAGGTEALEWVLEQEPGYAGGNAAALLGKAPETIVEPTPVVGGEVTPVASGEVTELVPSQVRVEEEYDSLMQSGDAAMAAGDYSEAERYYRQASVIAAPWLLSSYARLAAAHARRGEYKLAVDAMQAAFLVLTRSAIAIPYSSYAGYLEQGDRYAEDEEYESALSKYAEALGVVEQTCNCGLEDWSILP